MAALVTEELTKRYGDVLALEGLSLSVPAGSLYGLLGPNGSGKTTTIELLTGQRTPSSGRARVLGLDPATDPIAVREHVGILPEREDPPSFLTPREYLRFVGEVRSLSGIEARIDEWATRLDFRGVLDTLTTDLSEGERQRVMLAQVFLHDPDLVFIDEPLVNLDPLMQDQVKTYLREYCERGNTLFLSTHFVEAAEELCTRVGIIANGRLVAERDTGALEESLLSTFASEVDAAATERRQEADGSGAARVESAEGDTP